MSVTARAPLSGTLIPLQELNDPVFAQEIVGTGIALSPTEAGVVTVCAPFSGRIITAHPHAFVLSSPEGASVLIHLGIDTVTLQGAGFTLLVETSTEVEVSVGQPLISWDLEVARQAGLDLRVPIIVLNAGGGEYRLCVQKGESVAAGEPLLEFMH